MKIKITLALFILSISAFSQDKKFEWGINVFPNLTGQIVYNQGAGQSSVQFYSDIEKPILSISGNFAAVFHLTPKSSIETGLGYHRHGLVYPKESTFLGDPNSFIELEPYYFKMRYSYHNIEVPINYLYHFNQKLHLTSGLSFLVPVYAQRITWLWDSDNNLTSRKTNKLSDANYREYNLSLNLGLGITTIDNEKYKLIIRPYLQASLLGIAKDVSINRNFWNLGVIGGFRF